MYLVESVNCCEQGPMQCFVSESVLWSQIDEKLVTRPVAATLAAYRIAYRQIVNVWTTLPARVLN